MVDEPMTTPTIDDTPAEETVPAAAPTDETPVVEAPAEDPSDDDTPVDAEPASEPLLVEDVPEDPPTDPIITDPVLPDAPADPVFETPLVLLDPPAVVVLEAMPDEDKTTLQSGIATDYWGEYEHFQCTIPGCKRDFLSRAAMVSHVVTEHSAADLETPAGMRATYDRYGTLLGYEEIT